MKSQKRSLLCRNYRMAVRTPNVALVYLSLDSLPRIVRPYHIGYIHSFIAPVIELQGDCVSGIAAILAASMQFDQLG